MRKWPYVWTLLLALVLTLLVLWLPHSQGFFAAWFPDLRTPLYTRQGFAMLLWRHVLLVGASSLLCVGLGVVLAIGVTRPLGRAFQPLLASVSAIGQTFPPAAVLAIAVPMVGFGFMPALLALVIYGLLPVIENGIRGLQGVDAALLEASRGMGMRPRQQLWRIELPLAFPVMLAGIRTSVLINIGTATIGSTVGAQTLGTPIIAGLVNNNPAYVIQGAALVALLAMLVDSVFDLAERYVSRYRYVQDRR